MRSRVLSVDQMNTFNVPLLAQKGANGAIEKVLDWPTFRDLGRADDVRIGRLLWRPGFSFGGFWGPYGPKGPRRRAAGAAREIVLDLCAEEFNEIGRYRDVLARSQTQGAASLASVLDGLPRNPDSLGLSDMVDHLDWINNHWPRIKAAADPILTLEGHLVTAQLRREITSDLEHYRTAQKFGFEIQSRDANYAVKGKSQRIRSVPVLTLEGRPAEPAPSELDAQAGRLVQSWPELSASESLRLLEGANQFRDVQRQGPAPGPGLD